jgi:transposase InsO family protein
VLADLRAEGWRVAKKTVKSSIAPPGIRARRTRRQRGLTRPDRAAAPIRDLVNRHFTAAAVNRKWCGDLTEVPTGEGKLCLVTVEAWRHGGSAGSAWACRHCGISQSMGRAGPCFDNGVDGRRVGRLAGHRRQ